MFEPIYIAYIFLGLVVGFLIGLTGMGGGVIMTPALLLLRMECLVAVGTSLAYMVFSKVFATIIHGRKGNLVYPTGLKLFLGSIPAVIFGFLILNAIESGSVDIERETLDKFLILSLGIFLVAIGITSFLFKRDRKGTQFPFLRDPKAYNATLIGLGFVVGFIVQFTSVGAGILIVLVLLHVFGLEPKKVVGTSILYGLLLTIISALSHYQLGNIDNTVALMLIAGSLPGIIIGSRLTHTIPKETMTKILNSFVLIMGVITIVQGIIVIIR